MLVLLRPQFPCLIFYHPFFSLKFNFISYAHFIKAVQVFCGIVFEKIYNFIFIDLCTRCIFHKILLK